MSGNGKVITCICGKICTSKPGITMHQKQCIPARVNIKKGLSAVVNNEHLDVPLCVEAKELFDLAEQTSLDLHYALLSGNKSAGRRARVGLNELRKLILPLKKLTLRK